VTLAFGQLNIYANGTALLSGSDPVFREESVHYAMLMHRKPEKILVISGGVEGTLSEVLKYGPQEIDYIEPDPWLIKEAGYFSPLPSDSIIHWYFGDPRRFIHKARKRWDVVIVNLSAPASAELNRFFSQEFFLAVRKKLNQGGIICLSLPAGGNYLGDASRQLHSVTYQTLSSVFRSVRLVPGHRNYFLASDSALDRTFAEAFGAWPVLANDYVNPDYVDDRLINLRSDAMLGSLDQTPAVNRDLRPLAFRLFVNFRLSQDRYKPWILPVLLFLGLMAFIIFLAPVRLGLFAGGMTGASAELLLLLTLQIGFGNIYWLTGLVFTTFMAGLAAGAWSEPGHKGKTAFRLFLGWQLSFLILALILAFTLPLLARPGMPGGIALAVIFSLVVFAGMATGRQFSLAGVLTAGTSVRGAGENYASDSAGAAMGIMLVTVFILPVLGAVNTSLVLACLNALVLTRLFFAVKIA
jgi:spermidine synthase